jgi:hypothetical protein
MFEGGRKTKERRKIKEGRRWEDEGHKIKEGKPRKENQGRKGIRRKEN